MKSKKALNLVGKLVSMLSTLAQRLDLSEVEGGALLIQLINHLKLLTFGHRDMRFKKTWKEIEKIDTSNGPGPYLLTPNLIVQFLYKEASETTLHRIHNPANAALMQPAWYDRADLHDFEQLLGQSLDEAICSMDPSATKTGLMEKTCHTDGTPITDEERTAVEIAVDEATDNGKHLNVNLLGKHGSGKTAIGWEIARHLENLDIACRYIDNMEPSELKDNHDARMEAIKKDGVVVTITCFNSEQNESDQAEPGNADDSGPENDPDSKHPKGW